MPFFKSFFENVRRLLNGDITILTKKYDLENINTEDITDEDVYFGTFDQLKKKQKEDRKAEDD